MNSNYGPPSYPPPPPIQTGSNLERQTSTHLQVQTPSPAGNMTGQMTYAAPPPMSPPPSLSHSIGQSTNPYPLQNQQQKYAPPPMPPPPMPPPPSASYAPPPLSTAPNPLVTTSSLYGAPVHPPSQPFQYQNGINNGTIQHQQQQYQAPPYSMPPTGMSYAAPSSSSGSNLQDSLDTTQSKGTRCLDGSMYVPNAPSSMHTSAQQQHYAHQQYYNPPPPPSPPPTMSMSQYQQQQQLTQQFHKQRSSSGGTTGSPRQPQRSNSRIDPSQMPRPLPPATELYYHTRGMYICIIICVK